MEEKENKKSRKIEKSIVITRMYAGSYISNKMGGEVINFFKDDEGSNYIYVNPYGYVNVGHNGNVEYIILTRLIKAGIFEVLGIAKVEKQIKVNYGSQENKFKESAEQIEEWIKEEKAKGHKKALKYSDVSLKDIYKNNIGGTVTFKAKEVFIPKNPIVLVEKDNNINKEDLTFDKEQEITIINLTTKKFARESLLMYLDKFSNEYKKNKPDQKDNAEDIEIIEKKLIGNDNLWKAEKKINWQVPQDLSKVDEKEEFFNFLNVIGKENDEVIFSNMFFYFFSKYHKLLNNFVKKVLKCGVSFGDNVEIKREKGRIDLLIEDEHNIVVIENKIKSGINGIVQQNEEDVNVDKKSSQLNRYYEEIKKEIEKEEKEIEKEKKEAQEKGIKIKNKKPRKAYFYIFVPKYNVKSLNLKEYNVKDEKDKGIYKLIDYKEIYDFFNKVKEEYKNDFYFKEFVNALHKHSKNKERDFYEEMKFRFVKEIKKHKNKNEG